MSFVAASTELPKDSRILITGGWGMLGKALRALLAARGFSDVLAPRRDALDLLDAQATSAYLRQHRPAYVFHLASVVFGLLGNLRYQVKAISENTILNHNLIIAASEVGVTKLFFAGTVASYPFPFPSLPLREDMLWQGVPHAGEIGYANAKRHALAYLEILRRETGLDFLYGVLTNLYGPEDRFDEQYGHVIPSLIKKLDVAKHTGAAFSVWGDGSATRDFMFVEDAARAILAGFGALSGVANISTGQSVSIRQAVEALVQAAEFRGEVVWQLDKPVGVPVRSVSDAALRSIGFAPAVTIEEGMRQTWRWYQTHRDTVRS